SIRMLKQGLSILEPLLHEQPRVTDFTQLAGFRRSGRILEFFERWPTDPSEAIRVYQQAIDIWEQLVREHPDVEGFQNELATFYHSLGDLNVLTKDHASALQLFQNACSTWEQLLDHHPQDTEYRTGLAEGLEYAAMQPSLSMPARKAASQRALSIREDLVA